MAQVNITAEDHLVFERLKSSGRITFDLRRLITQQWNICNFCNTQITTGRPAFAGYDSNETPVFVGACCAHELHELATPVYWSGSLNLSVPDTDSVWRYMDFSKFIAMLDQGGLYLPRAEYLEDAFEGASGLASREAEWDKFYHDYFRNIVMSYPAQDNQKEFSSEMGDLQAKRLLQQIKSISKSARNQLVSCWHRNETESEAIWRLYCPPPVPGVAIRTSVGKLWDACRSSNGVVGKVHYLDFRRSFSSIQSERIFQKRVSLSHENEVRVVLQNDSQNPVGGRVMKCDLASLISDVVISPFAPSWLSGVVSSAVEKFGYSFDIRRSELLDAPFY